MVEAHQGCVFAVLLPSLFFLLVAWQGKGQRREHERNESACVHLFGKLCNTSWRPNIWLPATSWPTSPHHHHPSHTHFLAGSPYQAHGCLRAFAPAHSFGRTHFPCTSAKFTAWLQQGLSSDTCSLGRLVFPNCPFLKQPFLSLSTPSFCFFFFPSPNIHHYLTWHYIPILCFFIEWTQYHTGNSDGESPAWVWEDIYWVHQEIKMHSLVKNHWFNGNYSLWSQTVWVKIPAWQAGPYNCSPHEKWETWKRWSPAPRVVSRSYKDQI